MTGEAWAPHELAQYHQTHEAWNKCVGLLDTEKPDEQRIPEWIGHFRNALAWGEKFLRNQPNEGSVKFIVDGIHDSLYGLSDMDANQAALYYFWYGYHWAAVSLAGEWSSSTTIEFLEQQAIPAYEHALQLAPGYRMAKEGLANARYRLAELKGEPVVIEQEPAAIPLEPTLVDHGYPEVRPEPPTNIYRTGRVEAKPASLGLPTRFKLSYIILLPLMGILAYFPGWMYLNGMRSETSAALVSFLSLFLFFLLIVSIMDLDWSWILGVAVAAVLITYVCNQLGFEHSVIPEASLTSYLTFYGLDFGRFLIWVFLLQLLTRRQYSQLNQRNALLFAFLAPLISILINATRIYFYTHRWDILDTISYQHLAMAVMAWLATQAALYLRRSVPNW